MLGLIKKDLRLVGTYGIIVMVFALFYSFVAYKAKGLIISQVYFGYVIFFLTYVMLMYSINNDEKAKADMILNSLPLKRVNIVRARYISYFIYPGIFGGVLFLVTNIINTLSISESFSGNPLGLFSMLFSIAISLIYSSLYLPVYYLGIGNARVVNQIFYIVLIMAPGLVRKATKNIDFTGIIRFLNNLDLNTVVSGILVFSIILYLLSLQLSKKIYMAKEF